MIRAAELAGEVVGFIVGLQSQSHPQVAYAHFIGVAPEYGKRGLARTLYELFFEAARARGCRVVESFTGPINGASIASHRRLGFEVLPSVPGPGRSQRSASGRSADWPSAATRWRASYQASLALDVARC